MGHFAKRTHFWVPAERAILRNKAIFASGGRDSMFNLFNVVSHHGDEDGAVAGDVVGAGRRRVGGDRLSGAGPRNAGAGA